MNWGKATVIILITFVVFIAGLSYVMFSAPADDYDHQYYEDGLNFNHDYDREKQVVKDHAQPVIAVNTGSVTVTFPQPVKGEVRFLRPSSDFKDQKMPLDNPGGQAIVLPTKDLAAGKWQLIFSWKNANKAYLFQQEVYVK
jgi:hypothetical protein